MNRVNVPAASDFIPASLAESIRKLAAQAENSGRLQAEQLSLIYRQKWFSLFVPEQYGGMALSLPEGLKIEEGLAWVDGSTGWTVTLCSGANWFVGFLHPAIAASLFQDPRVCLAGSGRPSGIARRTPGGYTVTGSWDYASGAPDATAFTANLVIESEGVTETDPDGSPLVRAFVFLPSEVVIEANWRSTGLIATASHRFTVQDLQVSAERCFLIEAGQAFLPDPIYQYPFLPFAEATLAVNSAGMAARFIELGERNNNRPAIREAAKKLQDLRTSFYQAVQISWDSLLTGYSSPSRPAGPKDPLLPVHPVIPDNLLLEVSRTSRLLASGAIQLVDACYPSCGMRAADPTTEINRVWRNLHTASQHSLLSSPDPFYHPFTSAV